MTISAATAQQAYQALASRLEATDGLAAGQMFGKPCLKIHGKTFAAQHKETVVFKLTAGEHVQALRLADAALAYVAATA